MHIGGQTRVQMSLSKSLAFQQLHRLELHCNRMRIYDLKGKADAIIETGEAYVTQTELYFIILQSSP